MSSKPPRLARVDDIDLPISEASGLASKTVGGVVYVIVVGDRTAHVAVGEYSQRHGVSDWQVIDLSALDGWPLPADDSQLEAVAVDGGSLVALMQEDPPVVLVADTVTKRLVAEISLVIAADGPVELDWDDPSSRGEGLVLLRGGRILVAKEKRPAALVEFGPRGMSSAGLSRDDFLADGETWSAPSGPTEFVALAAWRLRGEAKSTWRDISDIAVGPHRRLWLLSDQSETLGSLDLAEPLPPSGGEIRAVDVVWRLPKRAAKPEGIAALGDERALVALDTGRSRRNGIVVAPP